MKLIESPNKSEMGERILSRAQVQSRYHCRLATTQSDVRACQTLRFLVFNLELNEGFEQSYVTCRDEDPFDSACHHLMVEDTTTGDVVGTYRLQTGVRALAFRDYYSAQEFDLEPFEHRRREIVELGRACVQSQHRNLMVLSLLWRGIADYARRHNARYLIGCSSLTSQDPTVGARMFCDLSASHLAPESWRTVPWQPWACSLYPIASEPSKVPKLLSAYLSLGAKICAPPAIDREFKTIDFLTVLDLDSLNPNTTRRFLG